MLCKFIDWWCCTSRHVILLPHLSRDRWWPIYIHACIQLFIHPSTHVQNQPATQTPHGSPLRLREASWRGSPACCRGRGPAWWAAAGSARSWWLATCSGCTPGNGWLLAGSGTTGRWCLVDCRVGEGRSGSGWGGGAGGGGGGDRHGKRKWPLVVGEVLYGVPFG